MFQFIVTDIFMLAIGAVFYLMARALPRIEEEPASQRKNFFDRLAHSDVPEKVDVALNNFLLKFLRRVKILTLKVDNGLSKMMHRIKAEENAAKPAIDFKEMMEQNKENDRSEK